MNFLPVIPSLDPDNKLVDLVNNLLKNGFDMVLVIDDGTQDKKIFDMLKQNPKVKVLTHPINLGKGEALKTAFTYYKNNCLDKYSGVVTLDSDGQHTIEDTINIGNRMTQDDKFILGTRLFNTKETPLRNKLGNRITSNVFKQIYGIYLKDTQTGLRAIPNRLIDMHLNTEGSRFEYEMNALIDLVNNKEDILEEDIKTVYLNDSNKHSHFKVFKDSYKIYKTILNKKRSDKKKGK